MRNWLILREKVRAFRADPEVIAALRESRVAELTEPTVTEGETWQDIAAAAAAVDPEALGERGMAYERLDQLALDHLYGVRLSAAAASAAASAATITSASRAA